MPLQDILGLRNDRLFNQVDPTYIDETMKPWLLNILACPIDKHHPLDAYFFTWETQKKMGKLARDGALQSSEYEKKYKQIAKQLTDGTISPLALVKIEDLSDSQSSKALLIIVLDTIKRLEKAPEKNEKSFLKEHSQDIYALHRYLNLTEVDAGLLVCPEYSRWYPIGSTVETIPEMLPDDLREKNRDLEFMEKWSHLIPAKVLEEGRPHNINDK